MIDAILRLAEHLNGRTFGQVRAVGDGEGGSETLFWAE
jgi:hypothetical protein